MAKTIARWPARGQMRATHNAAAVRNAALLSVCPLGKLEPQAHCASHNAGRARPTMALMAQTSSAAEPSDAPTSKASYRRLAMSNATVTEAPAGIRNPAVPLTVTAAKKPVSAAGTCSRMNHNTAASTGPDSLASTSSITLIPLTASVSMPSNARRRFVKCTAQGARLMRAKALISA